MLSIINYVSTHCCDREPCSTLLLAHCPLWSSVPTITAAVRIHRKTKNVFEKNHRVLNIENKPVTYERGYDKSTLKDTGEHRPGKKNTPDRRLSNVLHTYIIYVTSHRNRKRPSSFAVHSNMNNKRVPSVVKAPWVCMEFDRNVISSRSTPKIQHQTKRWMGQAATSWRPSGSPASTPQRLDADNLRGRYYIQRTLNSDGAGQMLFHRAIK